MAPLTPARVLGLLVAVGMIAAGVLWSLQGLEYVQGTFTNSKSWSLIGPGTAGLGVALVIVLLQKRH